MEIHIHILDSLVVKGRICNTLEKIGIVFEPSKVGWSWNLFHKLSALIPCRLETPNLKMKLWNSFFFILKNWQNAVTILYFHSVDMLKTKSRKYRGMFAVHSQEKSRQGWKKGLVSINRTLCKSQIGPDQMSVRVSTPVGMLHPSQMLYGNLSWFG